MKFNIQLKSADSVQEIDGYWKDADYIALLEKYSFPDAETIKPENLREMLFMAISDFEPNEAAEILLTYKLSDHLNEGQRAQISNEMLLDKICEEYPEIHLHHDLFNINQLLFKAYNGKFPNAKATIVHFSMTPEQETQSEITKEIILKSFNRGLSDSNVIKRLFSDQMSTDALFPEAEHILWKLEDNGNGDFSFTTSEYWMNKDEIIASEWEGEALVTEKDEEE